jgi:hypothetical protein
VAISKKIAASAPLALEKRGKSLLMLIFALSMIENAANPAAVRRTI